MSVQKIRSQGKVQCPPVIAGTLKRSLLPEIGCRGTIRHTALEVAVEADVVFGGESRPEHKVLPVGLRSAGQFCYPVSCLSTGRIRLGIEFLQFRCCHHRYLA